MSGPPYGGCPREELEARIYYSSNSLAIVIFFKKKWFPLLFR